MDIKYHLRRNLLRILCSKSFVIAPNIIWNVGNNLRFFLSFWPKDQKVIEVFYEMHIFNFVIIMINCIVFKYSKVGKSISLLYARRSKFTFSRFNQAFKTFVRKLKLLLSFLTKLFYKLAKVNGSLKTHVQLCGRLKKKIQY